MTATIKKYGGCRLDKCITELFEEIDFVPKGKIFVKPNLCARAKGRTSENTSIDFMEALVRVLKGFGCKTFIGHTSLLGIEESKYPFEKVLEISGFNVFKGKSDVEIYDIEKNDIQTVKASGIDLKIPVIKGKFDSYINLAKLKTHMQTGVSLSLKNQMGLVALRNRMDMHAMGLDEFIPKLAAAIKPDISIIDGITAMEGNGPHHGESKRINLLFCGDDMVELDSLAAMAIGFDPDRIGHIRRASEMNIGKMADKKTAEKYKEYFVKLRAAKKYVKKGLKLYVWPSSGCPGCFIALEKASKNVMSDAKLTAKYIKALYFSGCDIIYGTCHGTERSGLSKNVLGFGKCAKEYCRKHDIKHLDGCPLSEKRVSAFLKENLK